jgi:hypothetical protein
MCRLGAASAEPPDASWSRQVPKPVSLGKVRVNLAIPRGSISLQNEGSKLGKLLVGKRIHRRFYFRKTHAGILSTNRPTKQCRIVVEPLRSIEKDSPCDGCNFMRSPRRAEIRQQRGEEPDQGDRSRCGRLTGCPRDRPLHRAQRSPGRPSQDRAWPEVRRQTYQILTRASPPRYILSPGLTPNAS